MKINSFVDIRIYKADYYFALQIIVYFLIINRLVADLRVKYDFKPWFNIIKYVKEIHICVISLAKKFVLSMIIRIFAASVLAKPLNNAQIVRGVFCLYTFEYGESYSLYKTVWIFWKSR